jgi:4,5-dihydroxyphthalate decarboxylase
VRAYGQTTGVWVRGILAERHGLEPQAVRWVTFEGAHVAEYEDPPFVERAAEGADMLALLREGQLDAVIVGNELPGGDTLRTVFPDPTASGEAFRRAHGFVPVNHLVTVRAEIARERPDALVELMRLFRASRVASGVGRDGDQDGRAAVQPAVELILRYAWQQGLLPRRMSLAEVWEGLPAAVP